MKVNFKTLMIAAAALAIGLTSCKSDDEGGNPAKGEPTKMGLTFAGPTETTGTYAVDDNATVPELIVKTVDVFIFDALGVNLDTHSRFDLADFTVNAATNVYTLIEAKKIATTTGKKSVYVGINLTLATATAIEAVTGHSLAQTVANVSELVSATDGMVMFSRAVATPTLVVDLTGNANNVGVAVARITSKVVVKKKTATIPVTITGGNLDVAATLKFAVSNINMKYFPLPQVDGADTKDPNWGPVSDTDLPTNFYKAAAGSYVAVNDYDPAPVYPIKTAIGFYATENTSKTPMQSENTYATISAVFTPTNVTVFAVTGDATSAITTPAGIVGADFWLVTVNDVNTFFKLSDDADAYATQQSGTGIVVTNTKYTAGVSYYKAFLNKGGNYNVLRNYIYVVNIEKITGLGDGEDITVIEPIKEPTNILVTVDIEKWTMSSEDVSLEGGN